MIWFILSVITAGMFLAEGRITMERLELYPDGNATPFSSPGFPSLMEPSTTHRWIIMGVPNSIIRISCRNILLLGLCKDSNITIEDGRFGGMICGDNHENYVHTSVDSVLTLTMSSGEKGGNFLDCEATSMLKWGPMPSYLENPSIEVDSSEYGVPPYDLPMTCKCGQIAKKSSSRIIGGSETSENEYPWVAALVEKRSYPSGTVSIRRFCGGTVITKKFILTAAHCSLDYINNTSLIGVAVGIHDFSKPIEKNLVYDVDRVIIHNKYNDRKTRFDISLLHLSKEIEFVDINQYGVACLPRLISSRIGEPLKGLGWGLTDYPGKSSNVLMQAWLQVIDLEICRELYPGSVDMIEEHQLCLFNKKKGLCMGDSGGPLVWWNPKTNLYVLAGVVSFGRKCSTFYPDVVTDVNYFVSWIKDKIESEYGASSTLCYSLD